MLWYTYHVYMSQICKKCLNVNNIAVWAQCFLKWFDEILHNLIKKARNALKMVVLVDFMKKSRTIQSNGIDISPLSNIFFTSNLTRECQ